MTNRRGVGYGGMRRQPRNAIGASSSGPSMAALGADLKYWWEVDAAHVTLDGSNVSQLDERVGVAHAVQATAGERPSYVAGGGPGGRDCITLQDTSRRLAATISAAAANRYGMYIVSSVPASGGRVPTEAAAAASTILAIGYRNGGIAQFEGYADFSGGAGTAIVLVPAHDTSFHLHAFRPLASGALYQIDGTTTVNDFLLADTVKAYDTFRVGYGGPLGGGSFCFCVFVDNPDATKDTVIKTYVAARFGLTLA